MGTMGRTGVMAVLLLTVTGCRTKRYVPMETVRTDTAYVSKEKWDSIYVLDRIFVHEKGETLLIEKTKYKYIERVLHDTLYKVRTDSIAVPYSVEKSLTWSQRTAIKFFPWLLLACGGLVLSIFRTPILKLMRKL